MYICPTCQSGFPTEEHMKHHFLRCWYNHNPNHKSKPAPRSEDIISRKEENNFFAEFNKILKEHTKND